jgi:hypothetical protein
MTMTREYGMRSVLVLLLTLELVGSASADTCKGGAAFRAKLTEYDRVERVDHIVPLSKGGRDRSQRHGG